VSKLESASPVEFNLSRDQAKAENVKDEIFHVGHAEQPAHLLSIIKKYEPRQVIIFSNFKKNVERIAWFLSKNNIPAMAISSLLTQAQRTRVMKQFKAENDRNILVATDVAARGLDIKGVDMIINFELADDPENYIHRIGRTGRAGEEGVAFSLVSDRDVDALSRIEEYLGHKLENGWLEDSDLVTEYNEFPREVTSERYGARPGEKAKFSRSAERKTGNRRPRPGQSETQRRSETRNKERTWDQKRSSHHKTKQSEGAKYRTTPPAQSWQAPESKSKKN